MESFIILGLAAWIWWQGRRVDALKQRVSGLEASVRALAAEREPLLLERALPPEVLPPTLTRADEDAAAPLAPSEPPGMGALAPAAALFALYVWYGFALASGALALSLAILCAASLVGVASVALPSLAAHLRLGWARAVLPGLAIGVSSVLMIWVWPLAAVSGLVAGPALAGAFHAGLAAYALRRRWMQGAGFAVVVVSLVLGVAGYLRIRASIAPSEVNGYAAALLVAIAIIASALAARASHRDRLLVSCAAAFSAALLTMLAAFAHGPWGTTWSWAPLLAGAATLFGLAAYVARQSSTNESMWWSSAGCALGVIGVYAASPAALLPLGLAAFAFACAYGFLRTQWRSLSRAALAACGLALLQALSTQTQGAPFGVLPAPWAAVAGTAAAAPCLYLASRSLSPTASASADALRASSWAMLLVAAFIGVTHLSH